MVSDLTLRNIFGPFAGRYVAIKDGVVDEAHHNVRNLRESAADAGLRVHFNLPEKATPKDHDDVRVQVRVTSDNNGGYYIDYNGYSRG